MPLYHLACPTPDCPETPFRCLANDPKEALEKWGDCPTCHAARRRVPKPPTTNVMESLDNGWQVKRVVRLSEADRLNKERARVDHTDPSDDS